MSILKEPNKYEIEGMYAAGDAGGAFLESIGKSDLAVLTEGEWMTFVEKVIRKYEEKTMDLYTGGDPNGMPFGPPGD